jgi:hypothetical protein
VTADIAVTHEVAYPPVVDAPQEIGDPQHEQVGAA